MVPTDEEEDDFESLMRQHGVAAYGQPPSSSATPGAPVSTATLAPPALAGREAPASASSPGPMALLRAELREVASARADADQAVETLSARSEFLEAELQRVDVERRDLARQVGEQKERVKELQGRLDAGQQSPLLPVMTEALRCSREEAEEVLGGLATDFPSVLFETLEIGNPLPLCRLLSERVAVVCSKPDCQPASPCVRLQVESARCEVCQGSDQRRVYVGLVRAAQDAGVACLVVVGGSPAYRKRLQAISEGHSSELELVLVDGGGRRTKRKAEADLRKADRVVLWGGSILDHATSELYRGAECEVIQTADRGLIAMLTTVRGALRSTGS